MTPSELSNRKQRRRVIVACAFSVVVLVLFVAGFVAIRGLSYVDIDTIRPSTASSSKRPKTPSLPTTIATTTRKDTTPPSRVVLDDSGSIVESHKALHYDLRPQVCPIDFMEHLVYNAKKITRNWKANGWGKRYGKVDISQCGTETPECQLWMELPKPTNLTAHEEELVAILPYRKCCVEHKQLRDTAWYVMGVLDNANITYFLSTGSALGAIRHGGTIVPWDTDVDIAIYPSDTNAVKELFTSEDNARLHYFNKDPLGKPMYWIHHSRNGKPAGGPHVEIFFDKVYTAYPKELLPLQPCDFYGRRASCPKTAMFEVWFPGGWQVYGGGHYHGSNRCTIYHKGKRIETDKC